MCGPYGHGWYVAETDEILSEYMTKNAHGEFRVPEFVALRHIGSEQFVTTADVSHINPIPFGIIPDTGEVVVQQKQYTTTPLASGAIGVMYDPGAAAIDLSGRAKSRIRATWDIAVPTVAQLARWMDSHCGKRDDLGDWHVHIPKCLSVEAQKAFFPQWFYNRHAYQGAAKPPDDAPSTFYEMLSTLPRICEALRRGGANAFWANADKEDRAASAERVLAEN